MLVAIALFVLAIGLAMDAFAVAVAQGACSRPGITGAVRIGAAFGVAQGAMPLAGWALGTAFAVLIRNVDHWIALVLLVVLGLRMIQEGLSNEPDCDKPRLIGWALFSAAMATSIDAAAAGITLPVLGAPILVACAVIGAVTAALCVAGVFIGQAAGAKVGKKAEILGGLMLIGLGLKIFVEHQFFGG